MVRVTSDNGITYIHGDQTMDIHGDVHRGMELRAKL